MTLTGKQRELLLFIQRHICETGSSPSYAEMMDALGIKFTENFRRLLTGLEQQGYIRRTRWHARAIEVVKLPEDIVHASPHAVDVPS